MKTTKKVLIILSITIFALTACKTKQQTIVSKSKAGKPMVIEQIDSAELILQQAIEQQPQFNSMYISKMNINLEYGSRSFNLRGQIRMITDTLISISIQPILGIEMFRVDMNPDGFTIYNKMKRTYAVNNYQYIKNVTQIDVNYDAIQAIFSHQLFTPTSTKRDELLNAFELVTPTFLDTVTFIGKENILGANQRFDISQANGRIVFTGAEKDSQPIHSITYGDLQRTNKILFPRSVTASSKLGNTPVSITLDINKIEFNNAIEANSINLTRYTKTTVSKVISL